MSARHVLARSLESKRAVDHIILLEVWSPPRVSTVKIEAESP